MLRLDNRRSQSHGRLPSFPCSLLFRRSSPGFAVPVSFQSGFSLLQSIKLNHASICDDCHKRPVAVLRIAPTRPNYRRRSTLAQQTAAPTWAGEAARRSISRQRSGSSAGDHSSLPLNESAGPTNACCPSRRPVNSPARQHPRRCYRPYRLPCPSMMP